MTFIDASLYPDEPAPDPNRSLNDFEKAEHIHRVCAAWDFGLPPEEETLHTVTAWKETLDRFPLPASPAWHTFRFLAGLAPVRGNIIETPAEERDRREGRFDPVADCV